MTATLQPPAPGRAGRPQRGSLVHGVLPAWTPLAVLLGSFAVATAVMSAFGYSLYGIGALGYLLTLVVLTMLSRRVEGARKATDRLVSGLILVSVRPGHGPARHAGVDGRQQRRTRALADLLHQLHAQRHR